MGRGTLVVLEGLDRSGKSTQCSKLVSSLQTEGHNVTHIRFPDRTTPIGKMIDNYLKGTSDNEDHVIHLLFSANRWELASSIEDNIAKGHIVVIDRYYYSGCVYSAAKNNPALSLAWSRQPEVGLPRPDVCLFLNISESEAAKRGGYGEERYESSAMQTRVRELFGVLRDAAERDDFVKVDAGRGLKEVAADVLSAVKTTMARVERDQVELRKVEPW